MAEVKLYDTVIIRAGKFSTMLSLRSNEVLLPMIILIAAFSLASAQGILSAKQTETTVTEITTVTPVSQAANNDYNYSLYLSLIGNGAVIVSLIFLVIQIRQQRQDGRFTVFEKLMSDFTQLNLLLVNKPQIASYLYPESTSIEGPKWDTEPVEKRMAFYYLDSVLGLCERAWTAGRQSKADPKEWIGWRNWLKSFAKSPVFAELIKANEGMYEDSYITELESILREVDSDSKPT